MMRPSGQVYYTRDDIKDTSWNLAILYVFMLDIAQTNTPLLVLDLDLYSG